MERATTERGDIRDLIARSIRRHTALAEKRHNEGREHGGSRRTLCKVEAEAELTKARNAAAVLKAIEEGKGSEP